jgi:fumarate reductase flavoprotein subunit
MTTKIMDCDLVVLGAGGAGLVAAVKASEDGIKNVIILEKSRKAGGASYYAGGPGVGSSRMGGAPSGAGGGQGSGSQDVTSQFSGWFTSKVGAENFVAAARTPKYKDLPDPSIGPGRGGSFLVDKMLEFCQKQGIQTLYETPARKFITDAKGKVTGVLADTKDGQLLVNCKACVIASGGFGCNYEKLKKYWPEEYNNKEIFFLCPPGMMGDGIEMAEDIGAYIDQTKWKQDIAGGFFASGPIHHPYSWTLMSIMGNGTFVSINLDGKRWKNESGMGGVSLGTQPGGAAYSVADNDIMETAGSQLGSASGGGMMASMMSDSNSNEARAIKKWREDLEYEVAIDEEGASGNHAKKANTLVELALKMKIDPKTFVETIERYNKFCEAGKDLDFGKSAQMLKPIKKPPFWAIYGHRFSQCTKGLNGIAVNTKFEVLNPKGEAMPGLYAAGDTCTMYGGLVLQGSARRTSASTTPSGAPGGASAAGGQGGSPAGMGGAPGTGPSGVPAAGVPGAASVGVPTAAGGRGAAATTASGAGGPGAAPGGAPAAGGPGGAPGGPGGAPGGAAASVNILTTEPSPCGGSTAAFMSGYSAGVHVAQYLKNA